MADIGTDHAQLPVALVRRGVVPSAIGIDVAATPLSRAEANAATVPEVELRLGDGLAPLRPGEAATIVIAGMGGAKLVRLLEGFPGLPSTSRLVLSPNTQWPQVRAFVARRGFALVGEDLVEDRGHAYLVLSVDPTASARAQWDDDDLVLGPQLRRRRPPAWQRWVRAEHARLVAALRRAPPDDPARAHCARFAAALAQAPQDSQGSDAPSTPSPPTDRSLA